MISIKVPPLGESIVEATIARWLKKDGDAVTAGETLVELETDKITVEVPALKGGVLVKRAANEGDVVKVDQLLGEIDENATAQPQAAGTSAPTPQAAPPPGAPAFGAVGGADAPCDTPAPAACGALDTLGAGALGADPFCADGCC